MSVSYIVGLSLSSCTFCKSLCKYSQWWDSCAQAGDILSVIKKKEKKKSSNHTGNPNTNLIIPVNKGMTVLLTGTRAPLSNAKPFNWGIWFRQLINTSIWGLNGFTYNQAGLRFKTKSLSDGKPSRCLCNASAVENPSLWLDTNDIWALGLIQYD